MAIYDVNGNSIAGSSTGSFYDVSAYGAVGNSVKDDTTAIQRALNACHDAGGGTIFFPTGTYKITSQLICYSNQIIDLNHSTILQGDEIANLLMGYCESTVTEYNGCHDVIIQDGTFDGGTYTTNNTLVGFIHSKNLTFKNCTFVNAYGAWHNVEVCACHNVLFDNCIFEGARKTSESGEMIQIDGHNGSGTWPWANTGTIDNTPCSHIEIRNCLFYDGLVAPAIGNHSTYSSEEYVDNNIRIHDCVFKDITGTKAAISMQDGLDIDVYNNTFDTCTQGIRQCQYSTAPTTVHDNRFIDVTTPYPTYASAYIEAYNNMIDGVFTAS